MYIIKLMLDITMNEKNTPKTMYRYRFNTRGLRDEKSNDFVLLSDCELLFREEFELIDETLIDMGLRSFYTWSPFRLLWLDIDSMPGNGA